MRHGPRSSLLGEKKEAGTITFLCLADPDRSAVLRGILADKMPEITFADSRSEFDPRDVRFILTWNYPDAGTDSYPNLEVLFCIGAGIDHFLVDNLPSSLRIVRMIEPGLTAQMQHYAVMSVLALARNLPTYLKQQRAAIWRQVPMRRPEDLCVGVMGLGHIGRAVLDSVRPFGFALRGWSRTPHVIQGVACYSGPEEMDRFLAGTDILICLLPLTNETRGILSVETLSKLPRGSSLINMARGAHLDQRALVELLDSGHLDCAILDVIETEPLSPNDPLWQHERVILTPHVAGKTVIETASISIIENLRRHANGLEMIGKIDNSKGY